MKKYDLVDDVKIDRRYVVCVVHGRQLPNWIFKGNTFRPFHASRELITYIPTKFRKNILIGGRDMPPKRNSKWGPLVAEFYFQFQFWQMSSFEELPVYDPTKLQENRSMHSSAIRDLTFSMPTFKPTLPTAQWHSAIMQAIYTSK